ncbi:Cytoplasmic tyrosine-protein kinase BMX [Acipenser ruthenus]|uniref:Cytoplasmic tyrosine-protein kinase BMX n=1 Tax=Acipenser ruthenus TaxID=7906 RepID=A0A444UBZ4_ACIRT|nr:Cytoplasmic tyrosine-protein kinase BMX [Acipenser ruthenus]
MLMSVFILNCKYCKGAAMSKDNVCLPFTLINTAGELDVMSQLDRPKQRNNIQQSLRKLRHPKLVSLYGVCTKAYPIYIVTEYMSNGCLLDYMKAHGKEMQQKQLLEMCLNVCDAMTYPESQQFIHRDLVRVLMWEVFSLGKQPYDLYDNTQVAQKIMQGYRLYRPQMSNPLKGGVAIIHRLVDGKHQYEVEKVVKYIDESMTSSFVSKGDKLLKINGINLEDLNPESFTELLGEGSILLTVHQPSKTQQKAPNKGVYQPYFKEMVVMNISMEMEREDKTEEEETAGASDDKDTGASDPVDEGRCEAEDLLVVSLSETSVTILRGRGHERPPGTRCSTCHSKNCNLHDAVVLSKASTLTLANMTIYHYKSDYVDGPFLGTPVVLNFTKSNCFLCCDKDKDKVILKVDACHKEELRHISDDLPTWQFVFYMKANADNARRFESAKYRNWFLSEPLKGTVRMKPKEIESEQSFFFFIKKNTNG